MYTLLIVDDDTDFRDVLSQALTHRGYRAIGADDAHDLPMLIREYSPDYILLDIMFDSGANGLEICRRLRAWSPTPIIMLSVLHDETTKVMALDAGADDYLVKPFSIGELLARLDSIGRRLGSHQPQATTVRTGALLIDLESHFVSVHGDPLRLTRNEYLLLKALAQKLGKPVTYKELTNVTQVNSKLSKQVRIRRLVLQTRKKLGEDIRNPTYLLTEPGVGYRLAALPAEPNPQKPSEQF